MPKKLQELYDELRVSHSSATASHKQTASGFDDSLIMKLVQLLLSHGVELKASDIHLEPMAAAMRVRYRIDGMLHEMLKLPADLGDTLIRSIKVKASMATDVVGRSKPQDGRIDFESAGRKVDLRLSSFPTLFGDVMAIRILDRSAPLLNIEQLGFPPDIMKDFQRLIRKPNGLVLVTGPANSGKTTTLYAALGTLKSPNIKIVTLEDPVEYQVEGIDQAQINPAVGVTFASGLRAILRQDSNIILVGEIRDKETAEIAIRAALTGHLVFSTLHTRHSFGAIARLMDMGIETHMIVASINGIMALRLVRMLCPDCKAPDASVSAAIDRIWLQETGASFDISAAKPCKAVGCPSCNSTGYKGRTGIFELLVPSEQINQLILEGQSGKMHKTAVSLGMRTMIMDGLAKVSQGVTTIEEVLRVVGETEEG
jgi:general secretion pathway protein E